ncbi:MAG: alpha/beta hydrolase [Planctomycetota bacterium]
MQPETILGHGNIAIPTASNRHCFESVHRPRAFGMVGLVLGLVLFSASSALAQRSNKDDDEMGPRPIKLRTKDRIELNGVYVPSEKEKEAITVVIVHEWEGQMSPYLELVLGLSRAGYAVVAFDYRGHGGSAKYVDARGQLKEFDVSRMGRRDVENIVNVDMETIKKFLKEENNEGNLNLNTLVVLGIGEGSVFASNWALKDWMFPSVGKIKQSEDVKALVMISPNKQFKGMSIDNAIRNTKISNMPMMVVCGAESSDARDTNRMIKRIEGERRKAGGGQVYGFQPLVYPSNLTDSALVTRAPQLVEQIVSFINENVDVNKEINPWIERP